MSARQPVADKLPSHVYVEVTNRCTSRCQTCIRTFERLEPLRDLTFPEFQAILDQFSALERVVLHGIGDPLLNAELVAMLYYAKEQHPNAVVLFNSNAILLDEDWQRALVEVGLDELRVSLDAATADTYARIRGIDAFETVTGNVRRFVARLQNAECPRVSLWFTAMRENLHELPALIDLAAEIGVQEVYVQRLVLIHRGLAEAEQSLYRQLRAQEEAVLIEAAQHAEVQGVVFRASGLASPHESLHGRKHGEKPGNLARDRPYSACHRLWTTTYITANGNVLPCCISPFSTTDYPDLVLGNIFERPFARIWNGDRYVKRRAALCTAHPLHPCELCGSRWPL